MPVTPSRPDPRIGRIKGRMGSAQALRRGVNLWPPYLFTGIRVLEVSDDFRRLVVGLRHSRLTSNYVGTLFGGSIFAMADPWWMIMMMRNLGPGYTVWDKAGEIEFVTPGRASVTATFVLEPDEIDGVRDRADSGERVLRWFPVEVVTADGTVVARVRKQLYVRRNSEERQR